MRKTRRKNTFGYTFLEIFLSLSIFGLFLGVIFPFFAKKLNRTTLEQEDLLVMYEKLTLCIQKALAVQLSADGVRFKLNGSGGEVWREVCFLRQKNKRRGCFLCFFVPKVARMEWSYWNNGDWEVLQMGQEYKNIRFLKLILWGDRDISEQFIFACCGMSCGG